MEKEIKRFSVNYYLQWEYGIEIKKLKEDIAALEMLGATHIEIETYSDYDDVPSVRIEAIAERIETDGEFTIRCAQAKHEADRKVFLELKELERLKLKYNP